jgi:uncharacterized protein
MRVHLNPSRKIAKAINAKSATAISYGNWHLSTAVRIWTGTAVMTWTKI